MTEPTTLHEVPNPELDFRSYPFNRQLLTSLLSDQPVEVIVKDTILAKMLNDHLIKTLSSYLKSLRSNDMDQYTKLINLLIGEYRDYFPANLPEYEIIFNKLLTFTPSFPVDVINAVKEYVYHNKQILSFKDKKIEVYFVPGEVGSGIYSAREVKVFEQLANLKKLGKVITCSSYSIFPSDGTKIGLIPGHIYSIVDAYQRNMNGRELLFIKLYDPQGSYGMAYVPSKMNPQVLIPTKSDKNEFDVEINDYLKFFIGFMVDENSGMTMAEDPIQEVQQSLLYQSFITLNEDDKHGFLDKLYRADQPEVDKVLLKQGIEDLYELAFKLEDDITELKRKLKFAKHENNDLQIKVLRKTLEIKNDLLIKVRINFKNHLKINPAFEEIKLNAKIYEKNHLKRKIVPRVLQKIKTTTNQFISLFNPKNSATDYLSIYKHHKQLLIIKENRENLLKKFSSLSENKQAGFIHQLLKETEEFQKKVFSFQSPEDLHLIFDKCQQLQVTIRKKIKEQLSE